MRMERRLPLSGRSGGSLTAKPGRRPWRGAGHRQERPCTGASCAQIRHAYSRSRNRAYAHVIPAHRGASSGGVLMCGADPGFRVVDAAFAAPGRSGVLAVPVARDRLEARNPPAGASRPPTPDARPRVRGPAPQRSTCPVARSRHSADLGATGNGRRAGPLVALRPVARGGCRSQDGKANAIPPAHRCRKPSGGGRRRGRPRPRRRRSRVRGG